MSTLEKWLLKILLGTALKSILAFLHRGVQSVIPHSPLSAQRGIMGVEYALPTRRSYMPLQWSAERSKVGSSCLATQTEYKTRLLLAFSVGLKRGRN